jgi:hypothetical protein
MSPQMNGEPREPTTPELAPSANRAPTANRTASSTEGDRPLLETANTDKVTKTTVTKEDATLAPLFTEEAATDFRLRWDLVQRSFVDNPQEAVKAGDELVAQVINSLTDTFSSQRSHLENELKQSDQSSTEHLRLALRRYRSFFERLLSI